jgi:hypothetical protein
MHEVSFILKCSVFTVLNLVNFAAISLCEDSKLLIHNFGGSLVKVIVVIGSRPEMLLLFYSLSITMLTEQYNVNVSIYCILETSAD